MSKSVLIGVLLAVEAASAAQNLHDHSLQEPATAAQLGKQTSQGCYASSGNLGSRTVEKFNSPGLCPRRCRSLGHLVAATNRQSCLCGDMYPPISELTDDSRCNLPCPGYPLKACGGIGVFTVYNTGLNKDVKHEPEVVADDQAFWDKVWGAWDKVLEMASGYWASAGWTSTEMQSSEGEDLRK